MRSGGMLADRAASTARLTRLGVGKPELDEDVGQEATRAAAPARRRDADRRLRGSRMAPGDDLGLDEAKWGFVLAHRAPAARA